MDALSASSPNSGPDYEALESVNAKYSKKSKERAAMRQRLFETRMMDDGDDDGPSFEEDAARKYVPKEGGEDGPGGQMLKKLMERAEKAKEDGGGSIPVPKSATPDQQPPPPQIAPPVPEAQAAQPAAADAMTYYQMQLQAWQQQVATYTQFIAANPEAASTITIPPPPPPPPTAGFAPPPPQPPQQTQSKDKTARDYLPPAIDGRNSDLYEIANTADVYLAQLKRDTAVRNWAREDGDLDKANQPFQEEGVQAIGTLLGGELAEKRMKRWKTEEGMVGEEAERLKESFAKMQEKERAKEVVGTGQLSYKDKLEAAKRKKMGLAASVPTLAPPVPVPVPAPAPPAVAPVVAEEKVAPPPPPKPAAVVSPVTIEPPTPQTPQTPTTPQFPPPHVAEAADPVPQPDMLVPTVDEESSAPVAPPSSADDDETRNKLRTLMGLTLKHRGGPGFGAGRLKPNEVEKYKDALNGVMDVLKSEAGMATNADAMDAKVENYFRADAKDATAENIVDEMLSVPSAPPTPEVVPSTPTPTTPAVSSISAPEVVPSVSKTDSPFSTPLLDGALRAVNRCVAAYEGNPDEENALQMRNALLKGASVINAVISQAELAANKKSKESAVTADDDDEASSPAVVVSPSDAALEMALAAQEKETVVEEVPVVVEQQQQATEVVESSSTDTTTTTTTLSNTDTLQNAYDALKATEGDGKFGLKKGISDSELTSVSDLLIDVRKVLMEELDGGIPE